MIDMPTIGIYVSDEVYAWLCTHNNKKPQKVAQGIIRKAFSEAQPDKESE